MARINNAPVNAAVKEQVQEAEQSRHSALKNAMRHISMAVPPTYHLFSTFTYWKTHPERPFKKPAILLFENIGGYTIAGVIMGLAGFAPQVEAITIAGIYCIVGSFEWHMIKKNQTAEAKSDKEADAKKGHIFNWNYKITKANFFVAQYQVMGYLALGYAAAYFVK